MGYQKLDVPIVIWMIEILFEIVGYLSWCWWNKKHAKILLVFGLAIILLCDILILLAKAGIIFKNLAYIGNFNLVIVLANTILPLLYLFVLYHYKKQIQDAMDKEKRQGGMKRIIQTIAALLFLLFIILDYTILAVIFAVIFFIVLYKK